MNSDEHQQIIRAEVNLSSIHLFTNPADPKFPLNRSRLKLNYGAGSDFGVGPEFGATQKLPIIPRNSRLRSCVGEEDRVTWLFGLVNSTYFFKITNHNQHASNIKYLANLIKKYWTCFRYQKLADFLVCFPPSVRVQVRWPRSWKICLRIQPGRRQDKILSWYILMDRYKISGQNFGPLKAEFAWREWQKMLGGHVANWAWLSGFSPQENKISRTFFIDYINKHSKVSNAHNSDDCHECGESAVPGVCIDLTAEWLLVCMRYVGQSCRMFAGRFKDYYSMSCLAAKSSDSTFLFDKVEILFLPMFSEYDDTEMIWFRVPSASFTATSCCCHVLCFCATYCAHCRRYLGQVVATTTRQRQLPI